MSRSTHKQHPLKWQPPRTAPHTPAPFDTPQTVQSTNECTGLMAQPAMNEEESHALSDLCAIHAIKPIGNPGKGNPQNDPQEIRFHRE